MIRSGEVYYHDLLAGIISEEEGGYIFTYEIAYLKNNHPPVSLDLISTKLAMPEDLEESALTINGKKNRLRRTDFDEIANKLHIPSKSSERAYAKFAKKQMAMLALIEQSFLSYAMKENYAKLLLDRAKRLLG